MGAGKEECRANASWLLHRSKVSDELECGCSGVGGDRVVCVLFGCEWYVYMCGCAVEGVGM